MELISILHALARHRKVVALSAVLALVAGLAIAVSQRSAPSHGTGKVQFFIDTRSSYAGDLAGGTEVLGLQAALLGALIADERRRTTIAADAGVAPSSLEVLVAGITEPKTPSTLTRNVAASLGTPQRPNTIVVGATTAVAIVNIAATAPNAAIAARLAAAGADALRAVTAESAPSMQRGLVVRQLGPVRSRTVSDAGPPAALIGIAVAILLFAFACGAIVIAGGLARAWRGAARLTPTG